MEESSSTVLLDSLKVTPGPQLRSLRRNDSCLSSDSLMFSPLCDLCWIWPHANPLPSPAVNLVELHDAAGPVGTGAAPPAAEAEAAARSRRHEPASLNGSARRRFVSGRQQSTTRRNGGEKNHRSLTKTSSNSN